MMMMMMLVVVVMVMVIAMVMVMVIMMMMMMMMMMKTMMPPAAGLVLGTMHIDASSTLHQQVVNSSQSMANAKLNF